MQKPSTKIPVSISSYMPTEDDVKAIGDKLTAYTASKGASPYQPEEWGFRAAAKETGEIVGHVIATDIQGEAELKLLYVEEGFRGQGLGSQLVESFEESARARNAISAIIKTPTWQGVGFYERLGYKEGMRTPVHPDDKGNVHFNVIYYKDLRAG